MPSTTEARKNFAPPQLNLTRDVGNALAGIDLRARQPQFEAPTNFGPKAPQGGSNAGFDLGVRQPDFGGLPALGQKAPPSGDVGIGEFEQSQFGLGGPGQPPNVYDPGGSIDLGARQPQFGPSPELGARAPEGRDVGIGLFEQSGGQLLDNGAPYAPFQGVTLGANRGDFTTAPQEEANRGALDIGSALGGEFFGGGVGSPISRGGGFGGSGVLAPTTGVGPSLLRQGVGNLYNPGGSNNLGSFIQSLF